MDAKATYHNFNHVQKKKTGLYFNFLLLVAVDDISIQTSNEGLLYSQFDASNNSKCVLVIS